MFTVALCDDDELVIKRVQKIVRSWGHEKDLPIEVHTHQSGQSLLNEWNSVRYDVVFLDIDMPGKNGIDVARQLRISDLDVIIVFLTGYDTYAITGYEVQAYRYILKPVSDVDIQRILDETLRIVQKRRTEYITLNMDGSYLKIAIRDILYVESFSHTSHIVTRFSSVKYNRGLVYMESLLSGLGFLRCHRSFLVNMKHVVGLRDPFITLSNGFTVPVSRGKVKQIKTALLHQPI